MAESSQRQVFPFTDVRLDSEVEACWDLAAWIGQLSSDDHLRSFTSLLIALLHSDNGLSKWFLRYTRAAGIALERIYESREFRPASLQLIKGLRSKGEVPSGKPDWTESVNNIATGAIKLMNSDSKLTNAGSIRQLGIRHLMGAYFSASFSSPEANDWMGLRPSAGCLSLVRQVRRRYPSELEQWTQTHTSHFSTVPDLKSTDPILPSRISGFAADTPEGEDQLNIEDDVYALSALVCSTRAKPTALGRPVRGLGLRQELLYPPVSEGRVLDLPAGATIWPHAEGGSILQARRTNRVQCLELLGGQPVGSSGPAYSREPAALR